MKRFFTTAAFACAVMTSNLSAAEFENIYVFGDSLSDNGNVFAVAGIPVAPYLEGRFSNGEVWSEQFAPGLTPISEIPGATRLNLAFGGADSGIVNGSGIPGFLGQVGLMQNAIDSGIAAPDANDLVSVWIGGNDYLNVLGTAPDVAATVASVQTNTLNGLGALHAMGARTFLVFGLPDLGDAPGAAADSDTARALSTAHNAALQTTLTTLKSALSGSNFIYVDAETLLDYVVANAASFGFSNTTDPCILDAACVSGDLATQNTYTYWDTIHPTEAVSALTAAAATELVNTDVHLLTIKSLSETGMLMARNMLRPLTTRLHQRRNGLGATTATGDSTDSDDGISLFISGQYVQGDREASSLRSGFDYDYTLFTAGADMMISDGLLVGIAGSLADGDVDQNAGGGYDQKAWQIGGYVSYQSGSLYGELYGGAGSTDYDNILRPTTISQIVTSADSSGNHFSLGANLGLRKESRGFLIEPFLGVRYMDLSVDGYQETGGVIFNLEVSNQDVSSFSGLAGINVAADIQGDGIHWKPRVSAVYEHAFDGDRSVTGTIIDNTANPVTVSDDLLKTRIVYLGVGVDAQVSGFTLSVDYQTEIGLTGGSHDQIMGQLSLRF